MIRIAAASLLSAVIAAGCARVPRPLVSSFAAGTEELLVTARELNVAFAVRDARRIESMLAPEYTFHYVDHQMRGSLQATPNAPRGRWLEKAFDPLTNGPLAASVVDARVHRDLGLTVTHYRWNGAWNGNAFQYEGYITDVWIRRSGQWQLLSSSANLMPSPY